MGVRINNRCEISTKSGTISRIGRIRPEPKNLFTGPLPRGIIKLSGQPEPMYYSRRASAVNAG